MRRPALLLIAGLVLLPIGVGAQQSRPLPRAFLSITPLAGYRGPMVSGGDTEVILPGLIPALVVLEADTRGGGTGGAEVELGFPGRLGVVGAFVYTNPDNLSVVTTLDDAIARFRVDGPAVWFTRLGLSYRLPEPRPDDRTFHPAGFLMVGPALVWQHFEEDLFGDGETIRSWGANIGFKALQSLGTPNVAVYLGVEDYITFWNTEGVEERILRRLQMLEPGTLLATDLDYDRTHIFMVHLGLTFRL